MFFSLLVWSGIIPEQMTSRGDGENSRKMPNGLCCCTSLRTGSLVIAIIEIVAYFGFTALSFILYLKVESFSIVHQSNSTGLIQSTSSPLLVVYTNSQLAELKLSILLIYYTTLSIMGLILAIILFIGVKKASQRLSKFYLITKVGHILITAVLTVIALSSNAHLFHQKEDGVLARADRPLSIWPWIFAVYEINIVSCLFGLYFFFVIYSYTKQLNVAVVVAMIPNSSRQNLCQMH